MYMEKSLYIMTNALTFIPQRQWTEVPCTGPDRIMTFFYTHFVGKSGEIYFNMEQWEWLNIVLYLIYFSV